MVDNGDLSARSRSPSPQVGKTSKSKYGRSSSRGRPIAKTLKGTHAMPLSSVSLGQRIVGPVKRYITNNINKSTAAIRDAERALQELIDDSNPDEMSCRLAKVNDAMNVMERYHHNLIGIDAYIGKKFEDADFQAYEDKNRLVDDVNASLEASNVERVKEQLTTMIETLGISLHDHNHVASHYEPAVIPSDDEESDSDMPVVQMTPGVEDDEVTVIEATSQIATTSTKMPRVPAPPLFGSETLNHPSSEVDEATKELQAHNKRLQEEHRVMREKQEDSVLKSRYETYQRQKLEKQLAEKEQELAMPRASVPAVSAKSKDPVVSAPTAAPAVIQAMNSSTSDMLVKNIMAAMNTFQNEQRQSKRDMGEFMLEVRKNIEEKAINHRVEEQFHALVARAEELNSDNSSVNEYTAEMDNAMRTGPTSSSPKTPTPTPSVPEKEKVVSPTPSIHQYYSKSTSGLSLNAAIQRVPSFDGTGNFERFKENIMDSVLTKEGVDDNTKYNALTEKLTGDAAKCLTDEGSKGERIKCIMENLELVYGSKKDRYSLLDQLNNLKFDQANPEQMYLDLIQHEKVLRQLISRGYTRHIAITFCIIFGNFLQQVCVLLFEHLQKVAKTALESR